MDTLIGGVVVLAVTVFAIKTGFTLLGSISCIMEYPFRVMAAWVKGKPYEPPTIAENREDLTERGTLVLAGIWMIFMVIALGSSLFDYNPAAIVKGILLLIALFYAGLFALYIPFFWMCAIYKGIRKLLGLETKW